MTQMQQRGLKRRIDVTLVTIDNLFIRKEGENDEKYPYAVVALSIMFVLTVNPWSIQDMKMWL